MINGRCGYIEQFDHFLDDLNLPADCAILTWDHLGQGFSSGNRADIDSYKTYTLHAEQVIHKVVGEAPYTVLAHSMGALIALYGTLRSQIHPEQLILVSPFLGLPISAQAHPFVKALLTLLSTFGLGSIRYRRKHANSGSFEDNRCTHSREHYLRNQEHPCYLAADPTLRWLHASIQAIESVSAKNCLTAPGKLFPIKILTGSEDEVVSIPALRQWIEKLNQDGEYGIHKTVKSSYHDLLRESEPYYSQALALIQDHLGARPK